MTNILQTQSENPIKNGLLQLILSFREVKNLENIIDPKTFPEEIKKQIQSLEGLKASFVWSKDMNAQTFLDSLEKSYGESFNGSKNDLRGITSLFPEKVSETLNLSLKAQAWKTWLETIGKALGRKADDIEVNGDIVTVKIPGHKTLVFDSNKYIIGGQKWKDIVF